ncbi:MAG: SMC-Scp complex subunit ScpB [Hyphomicrobiaceae bacterium]
MERAHPSADGHGAHEARPDRIAHLPSAARNAALRALEATLFAAGRPLSIRDLERVAGEDDLAQLLADLRTQYAGRGVNLVEVAGGWMFRTAPDLAHLLEVHVVEERRLSRAALETLAIIAYHQPVTRADIEDIRGVATSKGTLDVLLELGWVHLRGRKRSPGRPVTYGTTPAFLSQFSLGSLSDLPGLADLKAAGFLDSALPTGFRVPEPREISELLPDEVPLDADDAPMDDLFEGVVGEGTWLDGGDGEEAVAPTARDTDPQRRRAQRRLTRSP